MLKKVVAIGLALSIASSATIVQADGWTDRQSTSHKIASLAREMGLPEETPIIKEASRIWWEEAVRVEAKKAADEEFLQSYHDEAVMMAKVMYCEARGISDKRELSMICWTILNRLDAGTFGSSITEVISKPRQFAYRKNAPLLNDGGVDLLDLAQDVLLRWQAEREGETEVGRTLPKGYYYYYGDGKHNYFRKSNKGKGSLDFGLENPYE